MSDLTPKTAYLSEGEALSLTPGFEDQKMNDESQTAPIAAALPRAPKPRTVTLPVTDVEAKVYSREQLARLFGCTHGELGRLLVRKLAPLPVRIDGYIVWFADEAVAAQDTVSVTLKRWRK